MSDSGAYGSVVAMLAVRSGEVSCEGGRRLSVGEDNLENEVDR